MLYRITNTLVVNKEDISSVKEGSYKRQAKNSYRYKFGSRVTIIFKNKSMRYIDDMTMEEFIEKLKKPIYD